MFIKEKKKRIKKKKNNNNCSNEQKQGSFTLLCLIRFSSRCGCHLSGRHSRRRLRWQQCLLARCQEWSNLGVYWASSTCCFGKSFLYVQNFNFDFQLYVFIYLLKTLWCPDFSSAPIISSITSNDALQHTSCYLVHSLVVLFCLLFKVEHFDRNLDYCLLHRTLLTGLSIGHIVSLNS